MKKPVILDASALLALIQEDPGCEDVEKCLPDVIMSSVNVSEVISILLRIKLPINEIQDILSELIIEVKDFSHEQALVAAEIGHLNTNLGLSLGDRACLALAKSSNHPVLTADKIWANINDKIDIRIIR